MSKFMPLKEIRKRKPAMKELRVSQVARSQRGFLTAFKRAGGDPDKLPERWKRKREAFIARHNAQYEDNPTPRRELALNAWAYSPKRKTFRITPKMPKLR